MSKPNKIIYVTECLTCGALHRAGYEGDCRDDGDLPEHIHQKDLIVVNREVVRLLVRALSDAKDHLEYCGYGDSWERECAIDDGLPKLIDEALEAAKAKRKSA